MSNLADKVTSASTEDKALFKNVNLLGRDYGEDSDAVTRAVLNLKTKVLAKKAAAQAAIAAIDKSVADSCASADAAAGTVVLWENKQSTSMRIEGAAQEDLTTTAGMVHLSSQEVITIRTAITSIKTKIQELANILATSALQKLPASMLQMHMSQFKNIVDNIKMLLFTIDSRLDAATYSEIEDKKAKRVAWDAAKEAHHLLEGEAAVQSSSLTTLAGRVAQATGTKDEAKRMLDDEILSQERETATFNMLRNLLTELEQQGSETSSLATHSSSAMLALAVGAERSHADVVERVQTLLTSLEAEMVAKRSQLQTAYDTYRAQHTTLSSQQQTQETLSSAADATKEEARLAKEAALAEYQTAVDTLEANNAIRLQEHTLIVKLTEMFDALAA